MKTVYAAILLITIGLLPGLGESARADGLNLTGLNEAQTDALFDAFAADIMFKPLEPASAYGKYWGVSGGITATLASTGRIKDAGVNPGVSYLPGANLYGGVQAPLGLAAEIGFFPHREIRDFRYGVWAFGGKWTINQVFLTASPVDFAVRALFTNGKMGYVKNVTGGFLDVDYKTSMFAMNFSASLPLWLIEPYAGIGFVNQNSTIVATGTAVNVSPLFSGNVSRSGNADKHSNSVWLNAGVQMKITLLTITAEYDRVFDTNTFSGKLGFKF